MRGPRSAKAEVEQSTPASHVKAMHSPSGLVSKIANDSNPYLQSLLHPATVLGAKVPDGAYPASATVTEFVRFFFTGGTHQIGETCPVRTVILGVTQTDGTDALNKRCSLCPGADDITGTGLVEWDLGYVSDADASDSDIWKGAGTKITHPAYTALAGMARMIRLVSCGIRLTCAASGLTNKGWVTMAYLPKGYGRAGWFRTIAQPLTNITTLPGLVTMPVAQIGAGMSAVYTPTDNGCLEYCAMHQDMSAAGNPDVVSWMRHDIGGFVIAVTGTDPTDPPPFCVEVMSNFEIIPSTNAVLLTATPCIDDPLELSHAMNEVNDVDNVRKGSGGFDHDGEGTILEVTELKAIPEIPPPTGKTKGPSCGASALTAKVAVVPGLSMTTKSKGRNKVLAARATGTASSGDDTFTRLLGMIVPIAEKVLPSVLGLL